MVVQTAGKPLFLLQVLGSDKVCRVVGSCTTSGGVVVKLLLMGTWSSMISCDVKLSKKSSLTKILFSHVGKLYKWYELAYVIWN